MPPFPTVGSSRPALGRILPLLLLTSVACDSESAEPVSGQAVQEATQQHRHDGNAVTLWDSIAIDLMKDPGPVIDSRAMAILHAAMHDAVNGVKRRYAPYAANLSAPYASLDAAVAAAARTVLVTLSPSTRQQTEVAYTAALGELPDGKAKDAGIALGRRSAKLNLDARAGDGVPVGPWPPTAGAITRPVYKPSGKPGDYDFTPPFDAPPLGPMALFPGWGRLKPFGADLAKHSLPGPDPLKSAEYARDVAFVEAFGRLNSRTRTPDQSQTAFF